MQMTRVSRRWFIGGAASFGAFGGCRFLSGGGFASGVPNLRFGVVSDIHINRRAKPGDDQMAGGNELTFVRTLEWFRDQGVDGVVVAGDMADNGIIDQLQMVAEAWNRVFPGDRAPDGRRVERLFVYGNHDMGGVPYARGSFKGLSDDEIAKKIIYPAPKAAWEGVFHEAFEPIWTKEIKGYRFVGAHWWSSQGCRGKLEKFNDGIVDWYSAHAKEIDPSLPFFHIQHPHPQNTCYGPWAWGHDIGLSTKALSSLPNAVAFSGHSHYPLTDERSVWQGEFTSVGTSSLRYMAAAYEEFPGEGFVNSRTGGEGGRAADAAKLQPTINNPYDCREGMLWSVYGDRIVVERREFVSGLDVGEDWVLPLPAAESKPFAFAERAKKIGAPSFPSGAALRVERAKAKTRGAKAAGKSPEIAPVEKDCLKVVVPAAVAKDGARAYYFEVTASAAGGGTVSKRVLAEGFNHGVAHPRAKGDTECFFALDELPKGAVRFSAKPFNCYGRAGARLESAETSV